MMALNLLVDEDFFLSLVTQLLMKLVNLEICSMRMEFAEKPVDCIAFCFLFSLRTSFKKCVLKFSHVCCVGGSLFQSSHASNQRSVGQIKAHTFVMIWFLVNGTPEDEANH